MNTSFIKGGNRLQTFAVAVINSEAEAVYTWIREVVWPTDATFTLPSVIVVINEKTLKNPVFRESQHLLCFWHSWNAVATKLAPGAVDRDEYNPLFTQAEEHLKKVMSGRTCDQFNKATSNFEEIVRTYDYFASNGRVALE